MKHLFHAAICLGLSSLPLCAQDLPPGVTDARLLSGWSDEDGNRVSALEIRLEPGWKTYWRNPGDSGLPPSFDWQKSENLDAVEFHWPAPEVIISGGEQTLGYHDVLVLPFTVTAKDKSKPVKIYADIDLGVCEKICVPAHLSLEAPEAGESPDPTIQAALDAMPERLTDIPTCSVKTLKDGMQLVVDLPKRDTEAAAMELVGRPDVWVSSADLETQETTIRATADFIEPSGEPFDLDVAALRVTQIGADGAVEMQGCRQKD